MTTAILNSPIDEHLFSSTLRATAPALLDYNCEPEALIAAIESDAFCSRTFIKYANLRSQDANRRLSNVRTAVIFIGLIDVKQFLFAYLLVRREAPVFADVRRLLVRAKWCSAVFSTSGPVNKDLAFVAAMLTRIPLLNYPNRHSVFDLFDLDDAQRNAVTHLLFGLREAVDNAVNISVRKAVSDDAALTLDEAEKARYQETITWANTVARSLFRPV